MADSPLRPAAAAGAGSPRGAAGSGLSTPLAPTNALSSQRYLAWLYSPPKQQPVLAALCQIETEVAASLRRGIEHHVAHARLQWWREECERAGQGRPAHPLTRELVRALGSGAVAPAPSSANTIGSPEARPDSSSNTIARLSGLVDTAVWDLAGATFENRKELTAYCERWGVAMFEPGAVCSANVAGSDPGLLRLRALGAAVREVELLAGLAREAQDGRLRVPLDELEQAGVDVSSLAKAPWPAALVNLLRQRHESLRATISKSVSQFAGDEQASIRGLLVWAELAWRLSWRAQRSLPNVILPRRYHALADGWHAWRAAHRASAGRLRLAHRSSGLAHGSSRLN
jgi:phytoene synthase